MIEYFTAVLLREQETELAFRRLGCVPSTHIDCLESNLLSLCFSCNVDKKKHLQSRTDIAELIHKLRSSQGQRSKQSLVPKEQTTRSFHNWEQTNCPVNTACHQTPIRTSDQPIPYLIVFDGVVTQTLSLSKPLRNFFCNLIWVNSGKIC